VSNVSQFKCKRQSKFKNSQILAEIAVFTALATVLSVIKFYPMPQGGTVTLASMVPIILLSLRRGPKVGIATGILYGVIQFMLEPYAINPFQAILEYPLGFAVLGFAAFFPRKPVFGSTIAISCRFVIHLFAGVYWWAPVYAPSVNPIVYSTIYNASYLLPELVISAIVLYLLCKSNVLKAYL
jgi:thiamine transporter